MLAVSLLGGLCIRNDGAPVSGIISPRLQALLAYLILNRDVPQSRAHLAFLFWPDTSEAQSRTNLRNLLHHLRRLLPQSDFYLDVGVQTLQWRSDSLFTLDVTEFESTLAHTQRVDHQKSVADYRKFLEQAITLYKGDLLPSCYDDWIIPYRETLRQAYLNALEQLVNLLEEHRHYQAAIQYAQRLLHEDPLQEGTYRSLIRLYALNGDRASALRAYHSCTTILQRELNVEPGAAIQQAYRQLLGITGGLLSEPSSTLTFSSLVGRELEWTQMLQAWRTVITGGSPHMVILRGEAGIGKTRLVEEFLQWAARQGITYASSRCYAAEGDLAYAPITAWLRSQPLVQLDDIWLTELSRLLPDVPAQRADLPQPSQLTEAWQRQHLFEALARAILGMNQPLLLTIDDLQWCDRDIFEWLHFLLRFDKNTQFLVIGAYRSEEVDELHPLSALLQALRHEGMVTEIELDPLDRTATQRLGTQVGGRKISAEDARLLYRETEGNPLFVVEMVRAGLPAINSHGFRDLEDENLAHNLGLPAKVRSVLESRLAQLSPPTRELAGLAAAIGREFSFSLLAQASAHDEETLVHQLDELWQRRIIREHGVNAYDFSHDKLREVAYFNMSTAHRRLLHRHIAQALLSLHGQALDTVSHQIAAHYEQAALVGDAIPYYLRAAKMARQVYANEEAITLLKHGLELIKLKELGVSDSELKNKLAVEFSEELGDVLELIAHHEEALSAYQNAITLMPCDARIHLARLHCKIAVTLREQRLYGESLNACHAAEIALGAQPSEDRELWWNQWLEVQIEQVWAHYWLANWPEMEELVNKVDADVQLRGSPVSRMRFLMASCLLHLRKERYKVSDEMLANTHEALALSLEWSGMKNRVECQFEVGFLYLWRRDLLEAEKNLLDALDMAETCGIMPMRTLILTYLTVVVRFKGNEGEVYDYAERAANSAHTAHMPDYVAAAKGNQAWLAWRKHDISTAELRGKEALEIWQKSPLVYPFQWQALWPLVVTALEQKKDADAWEYVRKILDPTQALLPDDLSRALGDALNAKVAGEELTAQHQLNRVMDIASQMGYL